jgi:ribonucleoside-diphosphate reductase alpha chain
MSALENDLDWDTRKVTNNEVAHTYKARYLFDEIGKAAWACGDPGLQFDDTINRWHTCKGSGRINASNPCSEYMFLDDTACNLGSWNLMKFLNVDGSFEISSFSGSKSYCYYSKCIS